MLRFVSALGATLILAVSCIAAGPAVGAAADTDDFSFVSFDADYYLTRTEDGSSRLRTVETLVARFPESDQNRGIVRAIPLDYDGVDIHPVVTLVTDADGVPVPYSENRDDGFLEIGTGTDDFVRGDQTYVITYEQQNVTRSYDDTSADEFYWDTNGTGWAQPFGSVSARVHVSTELAPALTGSTSCYVGSQGSTDRCQVAETADADGPVFTSTAQNLDAGENLTVAIGFDPGTFSEPTRVRDQAWVTIVPTAIAGIGAVLLGLVALLRRTRWNDARGRGVVVARYTRPPGIDVLAAGEIVNGSKPIDRTSMTIAAQLMDLAVRGHLLVVDGTEVAARSDEATVYSLEFVSAAGLDPAETAVIRALFDRDPDPGSRIRISSSPTIGKKLIARAKEARQRVIDLGLRRKLPAAPRSFGIAAVVLTIAAIAAFVLVVATGGLTWLGGVLLVAALVLAAGITVVTAKRSALTVSGAELRDHLEGLRDYIRLAEADRLRLLQSPEGAERRASTRAAVDTETGGEVVRVYEKLLPFAMLFGLEKQWTAELTRLYDSSGSSPGWYRGSRPFDGVAFQGLLRATRAQASASTWSSSSGGSSFGGSTGGGFSGGGGGGGGGGGR